MRIAGGELLFRRVFGIGEIPAVPKLVSLPRVRALK